MLSREQKHSLSPKVSQINRQSCTKCNECYPIVLSFCFKKERKKLLSWTNSNTRRTRPVSWQRWAKEETLILSLTHIPATVTNLKTYTGPTHYGGLSHLNCILSIMYIDVSHKSLFRLNWMGYQSHRSWNFYIEISNDRNSLIAVELRMRLWQQC